MRGQGWAGGRFCLALGVVEIEPAGTVEGLLGRADRQAAWQDRVLRKALTPNDFTDLGGLKQRLLGFRHRYQQTAIPFDWRFTRTDLDRLLRRLGEQERLARAA